MYGDTQIHWLKWTKNVFTIMVKAWLNLFSVANNRKMVTLLWLWSIVDAKRCNVFSLNVTSSIEDPDFCITDYVVALFLVYFFPSKAKMSTVVTWRHMSHLDGNQYALHIASLYVFILRWHFAFLPLYFVALKSGCRNGCSPAPA